MLPLNDWTYYGFHVQFYYALDRREGAISVAFVCPSVRPSNT